MTYGALVSVFRSAAVHELLMAKEGLPGAVLLAAVALVPLDAAMGVLVLISILGVEENLVTEAARVLLGSLSLGVSLGRHVLPVSDLTVVVSPQVDVEVLA